MLGHGLFRPILPILARRFGATGLEVGLLTSGFMLARAITSYFIGKNIDFSGHRSIYVKIGFFCVFIIAFAYILVDTYHGLLLLRFGQGICSGLMWPATQIMVAEQADKDFRTRALSVYQITGRLGGLLSRAVLSVILIVTAELGLGELSSFRVVFIAGGIILMLGFFDTIFIPAQKRLPGVKREGRPPYSIFLLGFVFGALMALAPISIVFLNEYYRLSPLEIAILLLGLDCVTIGAMYSSSYLTDHIGVSNALWFIIIPCLVCALFLPFIRVFIIFIPVYFILRMAISSFVPISRAYATNIGKGVGSNIGTLNMMANLGSVVGPIIGGFVYDHFVHNFRIAGYSVIVVLLIPGLLILLRNRKI